MSGRVVEGSRTRRSPPIRCAADADTSEVATEAASVRSARAATETPLPRVARGFLAFGMESGVAVLRRAE
jgi:hypothetical protein